MQRNLPSNVARFEQLMYVAFGLGLIEIPFVWHRLASRDGAGSRFLEFVALLAGLYFVSFIYFASRRHKNWARWTLLIVFVLTLPWTFEFGHSTELNMIIGILDSCQIAAEMLAFFLIFTGNAREWFGPAYADQPGHNWRDA